MARRILNRKEMRADFDAAERVKSESEEAEENDDADDEDDDEDEGDEEGGEESGEGDEDAGDDDEDAGDDDDEDAPKRKKKKSKAAPKVKAPKKATKSRSRAAKVVRMKVVWCVFNNSNAQVAKYDYPRRKDAEEHAARLTADKKSTHFVQPVKEPIEEKKE